MIRTMLAAWLAVSTAAAAEMPRDKSHVNRLGMRLVRIEPGRLTMGDETGDFDERPAHPVAITRPFYLGACEVTNAQFEQFSPAHRALRGKLGFSTRDDEAVVFVSWHEAEAFCRWLSEKEGLPYRLPTEAEWEYACRAGTTTRYHTGDSLPAAMLKNPGTSWYPATKRPDGADVVELRVGQTPANAWGLFDLHGNVEEWCADWYGPYAEGLQTDPTGRAAGDFRVTRGGSHSTTAEYLRSANRAGALPEDRSWLIGFRLALGPAPDGKPLAVRTAERPAPSAAAPDTAPTERAYFRGPRVYVNVPPNSQGPLFSKHNHDAGLAVCPNGDLLAIWYTCRTEPGRELGIATSRLRRGAEDWEPAAPFWDAPDRNDHAPALWCDGRVLYHFNGLSAAATWGNLAVILRTSEDNGQTWSPARLIRPEHGGRQQPVTNAIRARDGSIYLPCDAVPGGRGGTAVIVSRDGGQTWTDPGEGQPPPEFRAGSRGAWIAGIHAGLVELSDGRLMALGRSDAIEGKMPKSISSDGGKSWTYSASPFPPIGGGQRLVLLRLLPGADADGKSRPGPIFLASLARDWSMTVQGQPRKVSGLFGALSYDEGETWPVQRLITDDQPPRRLQAGGNTGEFTLGPDSAEPRGYLAVAQGPDGIIHLISSRLHYAFNRAWLERK